MSGRVTQIWVIVACDSRKLVQNCSVQYYCNLETVQSSCEIMNALRVVGDRHLLFLITLTCCLFQAVNSEVCKPVAGSYCHCRTDSGYEIDLTPLAAGQGAK